MWPCMLNTTPSIQLQKLQESILISIEEIFQNISTQMLQSKYTLNLGQLLNIDLEFKKYLS
jgi:hypothetical protein